MCPPRCADNFRSIQGRSGVGRARTRAGAHIFLRPHFHSGGMCDSGAAGRLAADRLVLRTAFSVSVDQFRLDACSQARFACQHAILPPQRTHATSPYQHSALSLGNRSSHTSQLMHAISHMHDTHFEHIISHHMLTCVLCTAYLARLDSRGICTSGRPQEHGRTVR